MGDLICPNTETCPVYRNWAEQTNDHRLDIINFSNHKYLCLASIAIYDQTSEGGIPEGNLKGRIIGEDAGCALIKLLNSSI